MAFNSKYTGKQLENMLEKVEMLLGSQEPREIVAEYGGVSNVDGSLVDNTVRCRLTIPVKNKTGLNMVAYSCPSSMIVSYNTSGIYNAYAYYDSTPVSQVSNLNAANGIITYLATTGINNIKIAFRRTDGGTISNTERAACKVYV